MSVKWINPDHCKDQELTLTVVAENYLIILASPATQAFVQSNHLYAGGDPSVFHSRFPAPVTTVVSFPSSPVENDDG